MLKDLNKLWQKALRQRAAWERWSRKLPHNRVRRSVVRDHDGNVIEQLPPVPVPEPALSAPFCRKVVLPSGKVIVQLEDRGIEAAYRLARYPKATAETVMPLLISEEEVRELHCRTSEP
jgi:hypothetical protein